MKKVSICPLFVCIFFISCTNKSIEPVDGIQYPPDAKAILDITKAPYFADNSGRKDCTKAINKAYDDVMRTILKGFNDTKNMLDTAPDMWAGKESQKGRIVFPYLTPPSKIIYFPNGTYKVSNTIVYSFGNLQNTAGSEMNRQIHFQGQSEKGVIIKLADNSPGFEEGNSKPVVSFMRCAYMDSVDWPEYEKLPKAFYYNKAGLHSNVAMSNTFENFTIDVGKGNPGAVGLLYHSSNNGAVRNVTIKSSDPAKAGRIGLAITMGKPMGAYSKNITVNGFDYGIKVNDFMLFTVFEHINLSNQKIAGFNVVDNPVSIRGIKSNNTVPAVQLTGTSGHIVLIDSKLEGGSQDNPAIDFQNGFLFARNIITEGYKAAIGNNDTVHFENTQIHEYVSHGVQTVFDDQVRKSLDLPVEETPDITWPNDFSQWASVNDFGAKGDRKTDDTKAIQEAMNSGKSVIYFQPGQYVIDSTITIPESVERVNFMFCDIKASENLRKLKHQGTFKILGDTNKILIIEDLFAWEDYYGEQYLLENASTRTLILSDIHTQIGASYINTVPGGKVFIENCGGTDGGDPARDNCYHFKGQQVWARQFNPERANPEAIVDGGSLWVLGFKTEGTGTSFAVKNGAQTEILGGVVNNFSSWDGGTFGKPIIINDNSLVSFIASTNGRSRPGVIFDIIARETRKGLTKELLWEDVPRRYERQSVISLYVGYK